MSEVIAVAVEVFTPAQEARIRALIGEELQRQMATPIKPPVTPEQLAQAMSEARREVVYSMKETPRRSEARGCCS